ncbi:MAG: hypothetical protein D6788_00680 [Planctomycetota bacterium]|nr:MAG: hypothetical protein D6788_00680 [Planctomycetota bacterium]
MPSSSIRLLGVMVCLPRRGSGLIVPAFPRLGFPSVGWPVVRLFSSPGARAAYWAFREADLVVTKGGHIYFARPGAASFLGLFVNLFPVLLGLRLGKRVVLYGQSIGPVQGVWASRMLAWAFRRCERVLVREPLSLAFVRELIGQENSGDQAEKVSLTWDTAFVLSPEPLPPSVDAALPGEFVALTVRQWMFPYHEGGGEKLYEAYLGVAADLIQRINREWGLPVVLAPQVIGPTEAEDDYRAWDHLVGRLRRKGPSEVVEVRADLTPSQLMSLYGRARFLVGTRFHSVILALAAGTPAVAISYHGFKSLGIMRMMGLDRFCFEMERVSTDDLWTALRELDSRLRCPRETLSRQMEQIRKECFATAKMVLRNQGGGEEGA